MRIASTKNTAKTAISVETTIAATSACIAVELFSLEFKAMGAVFCATAASEEVALASVRVVEALLLLKLLEVEEVKLSLV